VVERDDAALEPDVALAGDLAGRELDRVPDEVRDDLPEAERVADELVRDVRVDVVREVEVVLGGANDEGLEDAEHGLPE
jgi:hypothetical protein